MTELDTSESQPDVKWLPISEIFGPTLQGEGAMAGALTHFVRVGGCDYRCSWCDTPYAVLPEFRSTWNKMPVTDIVKRVKELGPATDVPWVTISGGNPALFNGVDMLRRSLQRTTGRYRVAIETQGSLAPEWLQRFDHVCLSPKPPSSGMTVDIAKLHEAYDVARRAVSHSVKIVVFDDTDLEWALDVLSHLPNLIEFGSVVTPLYLSAGTPQGQPNEPTQDEIIDRTKWLKDALASRRHSHLDIRILPQLHVLLWGTARGK